MFCLFFSFGKHPRASPERRCVRTHTITSVLYEEKCGSCTLVTELYRSKTVYFFPSSRKKKFRPWKTWTVMRDVLHARLAYSISDVHDPPEPLPDLSRPQNPVLPPFDFPGARHINYSPYPIPFIPPPRHPPHRDPRLLFLLAPAIGEIRDPRR